MTTIKKYFAPVLVLSAALLLLSCGKDDNGNGGGNGGGEGGDPNPPVPTEKTTVWDSNSLHFAKLFGEVQKVDTLFDGVNTALFDRNGYITSYKIKGYDAANNPVEYAFQCTYNADSLVTSITSDQMTVTFLYGDHGKYIEVEQDIFEYNQLDYLYVFQPRFLKNLTSVVINAQGQRLEFGFEVSGDRMTVKAPDGTVWSETTYAGEFPAQRVTEYSGEEYKTDDEGNYVKEDGQYVKVSYTAVATETFQFNAENGNLLSKPSRITRPRRARLRTCITTTCSTRSPARATRSTPTTTSGSISTSRATCWSATSRCSATSGTTGTTARKRPSYSAIPLLSATDATSATISGRPQNDK